MNALSPRIIRARRRHEDLRQVAIGGLSWCRGRMDTVLNPFKIVWNSLACIGELLG